MATRYQFIDESLNTYDLDNESWKMLADDLSIEVDIIERSSQSGADFPGIQRDQSKELSFVYNLDKGTDTNFRAVINEVIKQCRKARVLKDVLTNKQTSILLKENSIKYDEGGFYRGAQITMTFVQLIPYWEDPSYTSSSFTNFTSHEFTINNNGYIETPPIITITTSTAVSKFYIRILEYNGRGILIKDNQFGVSGLNTYVINMAEGTVLLSDIDRKAYVKQGTGPFKLGLGTNTVEIVASDTISATIQYKERSYI